METLRIRDIQEAQLRNAWERSPALMSTAAWSGTPATRRLTFSVGPQGTSITPFLYPRLAHPTALDYLFRTCERLTEYLFRVPDLVWARPQLQNLFDFSPRGWATLAAARSYPFASMLVRWDTNALAEDAEAVRSFRAVEVNAIGIGGLVFVDTLQELVGNWVVPELLKAEPALPLSRMAALPSPLEALLAELTRLAAQNGSDGVVSFLLTRHAPFSYFHEFHLMAERLGTHGIPAVVALPDAWVLGDNGTIRVANKPLASAYRFFDLEELFADIGTDERPRQALLAALSQGRICATLAGEWEQKAVFEILSTPAWIAGLGANEALLRRHIPWTRKVWDRKTEGMDWMTTVDLLEYVREHRQELVLKPNRSFGGSGVCLGWTMTQEEWEDRIKAIVQGEEGWVVQERVDLLQRDYPIFLEGKTRWTTMCVDTPVHVGFRPGHLRAAGIASRVSADPVTNVARVGGQGCWWVRV